MNVVAVILYKKKLVAGNSNSQNLLIEKLFMFPCS